MVKSKLRFQAYVDALLFQECKEYCHKHEVSMSCFIEQLLTDFFYGSKVDSNPDSNLFDIEAEVDRLLNIKLSPFLDRLDQLENRFSLDNELELESTPPLELESTPPLELESKVELEPKVELTPIPPNCPRGTKETLVAEFLESGELVGYFAKGGKIISDPFKAQVYKRFDSAQRAINKMTVYFPDRIFRILDADQFLEANKLIE